MSDVWGSTGGTHFTSNLNNPGVLLLDEHRSQYFVKICEMVSEASLQAREQCWLA